MNRLTAPNWARPANYTTITCAICGKEIYEEFEAVKPKGAKKPNYYHTSCIEKEQRKAKEAPANE